jgi:hypothetical protein
MLEGGNDGHLFTILRFGADVALIDLVAAGAAVIACLLGGWRARVRQGLLGMLAREGGVAGRPVVVRPAELALRPPKYRTVPGQPAVVRRQPGPRRGQVACVESQRGRQPL